MLKRNGVIYVCDGNRNYRVPLTSHPPAIEVFLFRALGIPG